MTKDWARYEAEIYSLYVGSGKPVTEIRRLLKGKYGLDAS